MQESKSKKLPFADHAIPFYASISQTLANHHFLSLLCTPIHTSAHPNNAHFSIDGKHIGVLDVRIIVPKIVLQKVLHRLNVLLVFKRLVRIINTFFDSISQF